MLNEWMTCAGEDSFFPDQLVSTCVALNNAFTTELHQWGCTVESNTQTTSEDEILLKNIL